MNTSEAFQAVLSNQEGALDLPFVVRFDVHAYLQKCVYEDAAPSPVDRLSVSGLLICLGIALTMQHPEYAVAVYREFTDVEDEGKAAICTLVNDFIARCPIIAEVPE